MMMKPLMFILLMVLSLSGTTLICVCSLLSKSTDQESLIAFKSTIASGPHEILTKNWSANASVCSWIGVSCSLNHQRVTALNFSGFGFKGNIPPSIANLTFLTSLDLSFNNLTGFIPSELSNLSRLELIDLKSNGLTGEIPSFRNSLRLRILDLGGNFLGGNIPYGIFNLSSIEEVNLSANNLQGGLPKDMCNSNSRLARLYLHHNLLSGQIPFDIYNCGKLIGLFMRVNKFTGEIPKSIGNLTMLKYLNLHANDFTGELPSELGNLNLENIVVEHNKLSGPVPFSIFNVSTIRYLALTGNHFSGQLPSTFGHSLPKLRGLYLCGNELSGVIPSSINNASSLVILCMMENSFTGSVPNLGNLRLLKTLLLGVNNLKGEIMGFISSLTCSRNLELVELSDNQLCGLLPRSIGNFSDYFQIFSAGRCRIRGSIPIEIGNLTNLSDIDLSKNELTGFIPRTIGKLKGLGRISLQYNKLQGLIPTDLCKLSNLGELYLSHNKLQGPIPECFSDLKSMRKLYLDSNKLESNVPSNLWNLNDLLELNFSTNNLSGPFPSGIEKLKVITDLDLSYNKFSGNVSSGIEEAVLLFYLSLAHNKFQGSIPQSIGNLKSLEFLDLSSNGFSGLIPNTIEGLIYLKHFNVSSNKLEGKIPTGGSFANFTADSFLNNNGLCGEARLKVPHCEEVVNDVSLLKYIIPSCVSVLVVAVVILVLMRRRKRTKQLPKDEISLLHPWQGSSYLELVRATNDFSESNKVGSGATGSVFIGMLSDGLMVAAKVFNLQCEKSNRSFETEVQVLRSIRHRNLVKVIGCCCNQDFKALILEYMPNGSLDKWLYSHNNFLDLLQRLNIAIDVALALEYLHLGHTFPIVHCDLKPSNVLLDEDMTAHVSDFGIAKLFGEGQLMAQTRTFATIGYMAPEYGAEGIVSTSGDVYSFGIMLLEICTRKKPTDERFDGEISLKSWVSFSLQENEITQVVDNNLLRREDPNFSTKKRCLSSILCLAIECLASSPSDRISISEVVSKLENIRTMYLAHNREVVC